MRTLSEGLIRMARMLQWGDPRSLEEIAEDYRVSQLRSWTRHSRVRREIRERRTVLVGLVIPALFIGATCLLLALGWH